MFLFILISILFIAVALIISVRSLSRKENTAEIIKNTHENETQQRLLELKQDQDNGLLTAEDAKGAINDIKREPDNNQKMKQINLNASLMHRSTIIGLTLFIPIFVFSLYMILGRYDLIVMTPEKSNPDIAVSPSQIEQMVLGLEQRLNENPEDIDGWLMFFRSNMNLQRYEKAVTAAKQLIELEGENANSLLRYADALALQNNQDLSGEPIKIIEKILQLEPDNTSAIWMAGLSARQQGNLQSALDYWRRLLPVLEIDSKEHIQMQTMIAELELQLNNDSTTNISSIIISIDVSENLKPQIKESALLYIYARSEDGNSTSIAGLVSPISDWPLQLMISDEHVLNKELSLANFPKMQLIARISNEAQSKPVTGDLLGARSIVLEDITGPVYLFINDTINF
ncbi:MAG: c-type cytochrome biogenesis protein CcmI [Pseudomonadota bacterium]